MIGTAIFLDLISIIPAANWVSTVANIFIFPFWFILRGVVFFKNPKILKRSLLVVALEAIPFVSIVPAISAGVFQTVSSVQKEDQAAITAWENAQTEQQMNNQRAIAAQTAEYSQ